MLNTLRLISLLSIILIAIALPLQTPGAQQDFEVHERGYWIGENVTESHHFDKQLVKELATFFSANKVSSIVDFGCGTADYIRFLKARGFTVEGYDGNPATPKLSKGLAKVLDLSKPVTLERSFDWVMSLEVGEHIPVRYEQVFIDNIARHAEKGVLLSWAIPKQGGVGHVNTRSNEYIKKKMGDKGFAADFTAEQKLRKVSTLPWFKNTLMVFRRQTTH